MKKSIRIIALALVAVMMCAVLVACAPNSDPDKAVEALKKNDYAAEKVEDSGLGAIAIGALKVAGIDGVKCVVSGTNKDGEHITIFYFEDNAAANDEWEDVQKYIEDNKEDDESDWVVKKSGKMIYFGTKAAVKAAK